MRTFIAGLTVLVLGACAAPATFTHTHKGENAGPLNYQLDSRRGLRVIV